MAEQKLKPGTENVKAFLETVPEPRRTESAKLVEMMKRVSKTEPKIWAGNIVGFGNYHYKYESGHEGDCFVAGFSHSWRGWRIFAPDREHLQPFPIQTNFELARLGDAENVLIVERAGSLQADLLLQP